MFTSGPRKCSVLYVDLAKYNYKFTRKQKPRQTISKRKFATYWLINEKSTVNFLINSCKKLSKSDWFLCFANKMAHWLHTSNTGENVRVSKRSLCQIYICGGPDPYFLSVSYSFVWPYRCSCRRLLYKLQCTLLHLEQ